MYRNNYITITITGKSIAESSGVHNDNDAIHAIDGATATYGARFCGLFEQARRAYYGTIFVSIILSFENMWFGHPITHSLLLLQLHDDM